MSNILEKLSNEIYTWMESLNICFKELKFLSISLEVFYKSIKPSVEVKGRLFVELEGLNH